MKLTLKDVYDMRNGMLDFTNKLFSNNDSLKFKYSFGINSMMQTVGFARTSKDKGSKGKTKDPVVENNRRQYAEDFADALKKNQQDVSKHMIALEVYSLLVEKNKELLAANRGNENNPVIVEFGKNVEIFRAQMLKNGILDIEIESKLNNDQSLEESIIGAFRSEFPQINAEIMEKNNVVAINTNKDLFKFEYGEFMKYDNLERFDPGQINDNTSTFYGLVKNAGFNFSRRMNADYYEMPYELEKCPSGYKFNEAGEMVEKESHGFLESISNFFSRLFNRGKVRTYNEALRQSKAALNDADALKDIEKDNSKELNIEKDESKELIINIEKEFENENKVSIETQIDLAEEIKKFNKEEFDELKEWNKENNNDVGAGLEQLD